MLHHVRPARPRPLPAEPSARGDAEVLRARDPAAAPLQGRSDLARRDAPAADERRFPRRRFVCVTFDDGYRDNHEFAYPVLKKYEVPFAIYVATSFADRIGELWWLALEAVIAQNDMIGVRIDGRDRWFECRSVTEKREVYDHIYGWLRQLPTEEELRQLVRDLVRAPPRRHGGVLLPISAWAGRSSRRSPPIRW